MGLQPKRRSGKSAGSVLFWPSGSPPIRTVKGTPVLALRIPPSCQPPVNHAPTAFDKCGLGTVQMVLKVKLCLMSKSQGPCRPCALAKVIREVMELRKGSPSCAPEPSSRHLL